MDNLSEDPGILSPLAKLNRDLRLAARTLTVTEVRYLVDVYYQSQRDRIRAGHQVRTNSEGGEPHEVLSFLGDQRIVLEKQVASALNAYSSGHPIGIWARSITGIGPIISAGLISHIDITKAPTVGHIWRFAGLDPTLKWNKGQKRPWNGALKRLCWLIGESFVKVSNNPNDTYGKIYVIRKTYEIENNEALKYAEQARDALAAKKFGADTQARKHYEGGKLPPARIHLRAERYAVKMFLSNLHEAWYFHKFNSLPPMPYAITQLGHAHMSVPPSMSLIPGWIEARKVAGLPT